METLSLLAINALNGGGGGGGDVTPDGVTTEFNASEELQANAVIHVNALPSSGIKDNSLYHVNETVTYTVDGDTETFTMSKFFRHEDGAWVSYTTVSGLTQADYDHLTEAQKADGTNYIVNGGGRVTRMVYAALDGKPVLNDVTIDGTLTLEDINVYSIDEVDDLLAQKVAAEFVDQLPATMESNTWYYSKKFSDGTDVPNDKRALYAKDAGGVTQYLGVVGDVDLTDYQTKADNTLTTTAKTVVGGINENKTAIEAEKLNGHLFFATTSGMVDSEYCVFDFTDSGSATDALRVVERRVFTGCITDPITAASALGVIETTQYLTYSSGTSTVYIEQHFFKEQSGNKNNRIEFRRKGNVTLDNVEQYTNWVATKASSVAWNAWVPFEYPAQAITPASVVDNGQIRYAISGGNLTINVINCRSSTTGSILTIGTIPTALTLKKYGSEGYWAQLVNWTDKGVFLCNINASNDIRIYQYTTANKEIYGTFVLPLGY